MISALALTLALTTASPALQAAKPTVVLVHGAFADASGWGRVITLLEKDGYSVKAVQNSLFGLSEDVATTKRTIDAIKGPVVVVGHSYGGVVISGAAVSNPNVKSLVYIAAYAPDEKEVLGGLNDKFGPSALATALVPDTAGFLSIDPAKFHAVFCADLPAAEARIMAITQKPCNSVVFGGALDAVAWKTIPSWYMVATDDQTIKPELERFMAKRMNARTKEIKSSHVAFMSHSKEVVQMIEEAAK